MGKVKTRLARTLGADEALRIYRILLEKTRKTALLAPVERYLFYSDTIAPTDDWPSDLFQKKQQAAGNLGERMEAAFQTAFNDGAQKVVIIGSDCPQLTPNILHQAFEALDQADFVIGPVPDGGYYLIGMNTLHPEVFHNIAWSTESVRSSTIGIITAMDKTYTLLPMLLDIDEADDWHNYQKSARQLSVGEAGSV